MLEENIQQFLNFSGVLGLGIVLFNSHLQPYLYFKEQLTESKQSLTQSIIRLIEPTVKSPKGFDSFEFPVRGYYAYIYYINPQIILLVVTLKNIAAIKLLAANFLQTALQKDVDNAITTFKFLANNSAPSIAVPPALTAAKFKLDSDSVKAASQENVTIKDFLELLNHLSEFTSKYMGAKLTINCWQLSRPEFEWLEHFQIDISPKITFAGEITADVIALQKHWLKEWCFGFIRQGCKIIKDLPILIDEKCLNEREKLLLANHLEFSDKNC